MTPAISNVSDGQGRARRIDVHHHIFPDSNAKLEHNALVGFRTPPENLPWTPEVSLRAMDELGIDYAVLSFPVNLPAGPVGPENRAEARRLNLLAAQICREHPGRFGFFGCLPVPSDTEAALAELAYVLDELKAEGIALTSSYGEGKDASYIGDDRYDPIWAELDRRSAVVFLHGAMTPSSTPHPHPFLGLPIVEVPNETFKAAAHLVVTGKKRRWPHAKIILTHLGGSTPFLAPRVAGGAHAMGAALTPEEILADFRTFYFDTALAAHAVTLAAMRAFVGADRLLLGSDFPAVSKDSARWYMGHLETFYADDAARLEDVMGRNASRLFDAHSTHAHSDCRC